MATPTTKATFKEYCLRALGKPVIDINVDEDQIAASYVDGVLDITIPKHPQEKREVKKQRDKHPGDYVETEEEHTEREIKLHKIY